ncbi:MAG: immunity protein 39 [Alphaproteobacteria bacterium]|nr:immunity protein 39 [Alphaproteobacteria bacterium]
MSHNRKFVPGRVALVKIRLKNTRYTATIQDEIEQIIISTNFLENAPFKWVGLIYRYGLKNMLVPEYSRISKKYGDLPLAIELDSHLLLWADENNIKLLKDIFTVGALLALVHVGEKYNLCHNGIEDELKKYPPFPTTLEDCEAWPKGFY